jgi:hypothetical protein
MSKHGLDKFYTKSEIVDWCLNTIDYKKYDLVIEPSVGSGAFYSKLEHHDKIGIDLKPELEHSTELHNIITHDFLTWNLNKFPYPTNILLIGNPPFGRNGSLALKFIKKGCNMGADIAFILPKGFKKQSIYDRIPLNYKKILELDLPHNSFLYNDKNFDVPCVWQIYKKTNDFRLKEIKLKPKHFIFTNKESSNLAIRRVGVAAGKIFSNTEVSVSSHYFIHSKNKDFLLKNINTNLFSKNDTTGPRSISKNELITIIDNLISNNL